MGGQRSTGSEERIRERRAGCGERDRLWRKSQVAGNGVGLEGTESSLKEWKLGIGRTDTG